jgi:hypothetical protein
MTATRTILCALAVLLALPLVLFGVYFLNGSLEQFPTDEQQGAVRITTSLGLLVFALLETVVLIALLRKGKSSLRADATRSQVKNEDPATTSRR